MSSSILVNPGGVETCFVERYSETRRDSLTSCSRELLKLDLPYTKVLTLIRRAHRYLQVSSSTFMKTCFVELRSLSQTLSLALS